MMTVSFGLILYSTESPDEPLLKKNWSLGGRGQTQYRLSLTLLLLWKITEK